MNSDLNGQAHDGELALRNHAQATAIAELQMCQAEINAILERYPNCRLGIVQQIAMLPKT